MKIKILFALAILFQITINLSAQQNTNQVSAFQTVDTSNQYLIAVSDSIYKMGSDFFNNGAYSKALPLLQKAESFSEIAGNRELLLSIYQTLANTYANLHNYKGAYFYLIAYNNLKDSLDKVAQTTLQQNLNENYKKQISENNIKLNQAQNQFIAAEKEKEDQFKNYLITGSVLLLLLLCFIFVQRYQLKHKFKKVLNEKDSIIQKLNEQLKQNAEAPYEKTSEIISQNESADNTNRSLIDIQEVIITNHDVSEKKDQIEIVEQDIIEPSGNIDTHVIEDNKTQNTLLKSVNNDLQKMEKALKRNDWQTIKQTVNLLRTQLTKSGLNESNQLFDEFENFNGQTPHRIWFEKTTMLSNMIKEKIKEVELT